jgi:electron transfer flavoprotein alpha subunit
MSILVLIEHDNKTLKPSTLSALQAAGQLGSDIHALLVGHGVDAIANELKSETSIKTLHVLDDVRFAQPIAELLVPVIADVAKDMTVVLAPATTFGKNILPRLAAVWDIQPVTDIVQIHGPTEFTRPIYAGNALQRVTSNQPRQILTIRPTAFAPLPLGTSGNVSVAAVTPSASIAPVSAFVSLEAAGGSRPELTAARVIVSGGRALGSADNFKIIEALADKLGAAVGASRAAVDAGYVPNDYQVGQTGKIVAPDLYLAIGISGAIQHQAGMSGSKVIVAINKDPDAPIFQIADYGLVADLFEVVPELMGKL